MPDDPREGVPPSEGAPSPSAGGPSDVQRQSRYNHLVGRLRSRQITMEEATELFGLMQGMLRASENARRAAAIGTTPLAPSAAGARPPRTAEAGSADDLLLVGLLAMGAGAGMLAAMARRMAEGPATGGKGDTSSRRTA